MSNHIRILHEYEIADVTELHLASLVYLREYTDENRGTKDYCDVVDQIMERCINNGCKVKQRLQPKIICLPDEVEALDNRLREEYQVKGYFSFYAPTQIKGGVPTDFSRLTIHTTILVKEETDIRYFENIGYQENVGNADLISQFALAHYKSPVYLLQEHPLVHSILCYKDVAEKLYFLYRYNDNPMESILAEVEVANSVVQLKYGAYNEQRNAITSFSSSIKAQNSLEPLFQCVFITEIAPRYITRLQLNRERDLFTKAKNLLLEKLKGEETNSSRDMIDYLTMMIEA